MAPPSVSCCDAWDRKLLYSELAVLNGCSPHRGPWYLYASRLASVDGPSEGSFNCSRLLGEILASESKKGMSFQLIIAKAWTDLGKKLTLPFNILTKYIPIRHGTLLSKYTQLYLAFIATTLLHHIGAMNLITSTSENNLNQVAFFMLQPVAITAEDFVIYLSKKAGLKKTCKINLLCQTRGY
jgi:hypothetical protein